MSYDVARSKIVQLVQQCAPYMAAGLPNRFIHMDRASDDHLPAARGFYLQAMGAAGAMVFSPDVVSRARADMLLTVAYELKDDRAALDVAIIEDSARIRATILNPNLRDFAQDGIVILGNENQGGMQSVTSEIIPATIEETTSHKLCRMSFPLVYAYAPGALGG